MNATDLALILANVQLGERTVVDPFCLLGKPPRGKAEGELPLAIGADGVIRSHTVIYAGTMIGARFQSGHHVMIREETTIGDDCSVGTGSVIEFAVRLGNNVRLHSGVFVPEYSVLEDGCWLGPRVILTNAPYPCAERTKQTLEGVRIEKNAKIGAGATILPGRVIGEGALVGAGAIVAKDVPPGAVVVGSPSRVVAQVTDLRYRDTGEFVYTKGKP